MENTITTQFTIPQIITTLSQKNVVPKAAIQAAIAYGPEIVPALLAVVKHAAEKFQDMDGDEIGYLTAMYILAKRREPQACTYILQIAGLYREWPEKMLGDVITEGLTSLIVSTYDGNLQAIKNLIEHTHANIDCRSAALDSLLGLFSVGKLSRAEIIAYFKTLLRSPLVKDYEFAAYVLEAVCDLYPQELWNDAMALFDRIIIDPLMTSKKEFEEILIKGMEACHKDYIHEYKFYQPIDTVIAEVSWLYRPEESEEPWQPAKKVDHNDLSNCTCCNKFDSHSIVKKLLEAAAAEEEEELEA